MPPDQAAGLRRRGTAQPVRCVSCFFDAASSSTRLAHALHQQGQTCLLVDIHNRLFATASTRSLFDWQHQLAHKQLNTLPQAYGVGWSAPGLHLDAAHFSAAIQGYDSVVLDVGPIKDELAFPLNALNTVVIEVRPESTSMQRAYRLLKTLSHTSDAMKIYLLGDAAICDNVLDACRHFLVQSFAETVISVAHEDDAFTALAVRMVHEETHRMVRCE